jgi:comEA protein
MVPFKPSEIRIIVLLALLALIGSLITVLQRDEHISQLDLGIFAEKSLYKYTVSRAASPADSSTASRLSSLSTIADAASSEKVDLNRSGYFDLEKLPGIGPVLAQRIISYRDSVGEFQTIDQLKEVSGIGPAKFAALKDRVIIK